MNRITALKLFCALAPALLAASCGDQKSDDMVFTGAMDAVTVRISAQSAGTILELNFDEGDPVDSGAVLLRVDSEKSSYQLEQSRASLEEITHQLEAARAQLAAATTGRDNLKTRHERFNALLDSKAVTRQSVDDLRAQLDAADDQLRASRNSLNALASRKKQIEAGIRILDRQLLDARIVSPVTGTVLVRYVEKGEFVAPGAPVCEIADLSSMWTRIYVPETDLQALKLGGKARILVDGVPEAGLEGTVTWISDKAEFTPKTILTEETRTSLVYAARIKAPNPEGLLKIGMPVTIIIDRARQ